MSDKEKKKKEEVDFETLYYQAMKENVLMKDKKISFEFTDQEISFLRDLMFHELMDLKYDIFDSNVNDEEDEENKKIGRGPRKDEFLNKMIDEKRTIIETIIKKLRFEL